MSIEKIFDEKFEFLMKKISSCKTFLQQKLLKSCIVYEPLKCKDKIKVFNCDMKNNVIT